MITVALLSGWMLISASLSSYRNASWSANLDLPCKCQQVFMSNTQSQMTCVVSQTTVCTAIHSVTIRP